MSKIPKRYTILRQVVNDYKVAAEMPEKPVQVWTLIDEEKFNQIGLKHWESAFMEDRGHDWDWQEGRFRFYGHSGARGEIHDLIIVFEL